MTKVIAVIGNLLALFIYGVGLLAPLTPSEGTAGIGVLLIFVGVPLILLLYAWIIYSSKLAKTGAIFQVVAVISFTLWLLLLQSGVLAGGS